MTIQQHAIDEALAITRAAHRQQPSTSTTIQRLSGGMNNAVYRVQLVEQPLCVKLYKIDERHRAEREWQALCYLAEQGLGIAPQPRHFSPDPELPAVVMELVAGVSLYDHQPAARELAALAETLKQLYALTPKVAAYPHTVIGPPIVLMQRVESWLAWLADRADEPLVKQILAVVAQWDSEADRVILAMSAPSVFSRGDPNLANCLWDGQRVRCVDLEYSGWSDMTFDLAELIEAQPSRHISDQTWERFIDSFELHETAEQQRLAAARRLCAVFWISLLWRRWEQGEHVEQELVGQVRRAHQRLKRATL
jgi:Ser/Thr protein kinase RdoA (MazF antagonist)